MKSRIRQARVALTAASLIAFATAMNAQAQQAPAIDADDIGGVVKSAKGTEG